MSNYDRGTRGVLVILIPVHVNLAEDKDLEKVMSTMVSHGRRS